MKRLWRELWEQERGLVSVEYALLLALIAIAAIAAWHALGHHNLRTVRRINRVFRRAMGAG